MPRAAKKPGLPVVDDAIVDALRGFVGPENPPVNMALGAVEKLTGPENPPVHYLLKALEKADPMGTANFLNPLGVFPAMIASHAGPAIWAAEEGKPLGQFRRAFKHTGEGSAYKGAGGYIAQEPRVTTTYRERAPMSVFVGGEEITAPATWKQIADGSDVWKLDPRQYVEDLIRRRLSDNAGTTLHPKQIQAVMDMERQFMIDTIRGMSMDPAGQELRFGTREAGEHANELLRRLEALSEMERKGVTTKRAGAYYTLDYPDELLPSTLSFEHTLGEQTPEIQRALRRIPGEVALPGDARTHNGIGSWTWRDMSDAERQDLIEKYRGAAFGSEKMDPLVDILNVPDLKSKTGEWFYEKLSDLSGDSDELASQILRNAGIPAHNFYDNFSRRRIMEGGPEAFTRSGDLLPDLTKNFVVYDPDNVLTTLGRHDTLDEMIAFQNELRARGKK